MRSIAMMGVVLAGLLSSSASAQVTVISPGSVQAARVRVVRELLAEGVQIREVAACDCLVRSEWFDNGRFGNGAIVAVIVPRGDSVEVQFTGRKYSALLIGTAEMREDYRMKGGENVTGPDGPDGKRIWGIIESVARRLRNAP